MQICIIICISSWKHSGISHYERGVPLLFCLSIYFLVKDFITLLRIEGNMAQMIVEGVALEAKNGSSEKFFHRMLQSFNFTSILVQRSLINVFALGALGYFMFNFVNDVFPDVHIGRWVLGVFVWVPSVIACKLYYDSLKDLYDAKSKVFDQ
ncbi:MAG: hypothetical protein HKM07_04190 [Chlamydiae bacterium]|nr:hypothetical protein [Chlamydiota bacterium]